MKLAEKFSLPIVTLIDTPGAYPGIEAEEKGQAEAIARTLYEMFKIRTEIIDVVIGEGASGGALGIGVGEKIMMLERKGMFDSFSNHLFFCHICPISHYCSHPN